MSQGEEWDSFELSTSSDSSLSDQPEGMTTNGYSGRISAWQGLVPSKRILAIS
jgi:hypothetical protein